MTKQHEQPHTRPAGTVCVVGAGYVGLTTACCLASLGHRVSCVESDAEKLAVLEDGRVPWPEPRLEELLVAGRRSGKLMLTGDLGAAMEGASVVMLCVGTPPRPDGDPDLRTLATAARQVARLATGPCVLVVKSTVPPGTGEALELLCAEEAPEGSPMTVVSNPEFLREGHAVWDFLHPDRVVVGADHADAGAAVGALYPSSWLILYCGRRESELVKYASNGFLAMKISFANEIARLCEGYGADVRSVLEGVGMDARIGSAFLGPGPGFGGSCLGKDLAGLAAAAEATGCVIELPRATLRANETSRLHVVDRLERCLGTCRGAKVAVLGLAFKAGTADVRDSPALAIVAELERRGATVQACDPAVPRDVLPSQRVDDPYEALAGAHGAVVAAAWPQFSGLDLGRVRALMAGRVVVDAAGVFSPGVLAAAGLDGVGVGWGLPGELHAVAWHALQWMLDPLEEAEANLPAPQPAAR